MSVKYLFCILTALYINKSFCQNNSIEPRAPLNIKYYAQYQELPIQQKLAAVQERDIVIYLDTNNNIWLAQLKAGQWQAIFLLDDFTTETELTVDEQQVDGSGNKEVMVRWDYMGKVEFLNVIFKGVQVWNTDSAICYLDEFTIALEERFARESDVHYYAGCERKIEVNADMLEISPYICDYDMGIEIMPEKIYKGTFYFSEGRYRLKETGGAPK
jgi:hypothetical protein